MTNLSPKSTTNIITHGVTYAENKINPSRGHQQRGTGWRRGCITAGLSCALLGTTALIPNFAVTPVYATIFNSAVDRLPPAQRAALRQGEVVVTGQNGRYVARVLVTASAQQVWNLLTDYGNLPKFIPNLSTSKVISQQGNQKVVEQEDRRQIFLVSVVSKVRLAIKEIAPKKIEFKLISGDLQKMEGSWQIEPVIDNPKKAPTQVLITHTVFVQPRNGTPADSFYEVFKESLSDTMTAVQQEVKRRQR
ncbi:MAG: SRPBCC family protein [Pseudanabaena sp. ELA607]|jgi:ribosome-associated toxin RatA of RatAB toxin-antitoxin module